jgi:outer membrane autotransporter protein
MKTQLIKTATRPLKKRPGVPAASIRAFLVGLSLFVPASVPVFAVDGVWLLNPDSGDWNTGTNWSTSPNAPVNPGDTATFNSSTQTSLTLSSNATVESITFQPGASAFTIDTNGNALTIQGAGIVNNSGKTQTITNNGNVFLGPAVGITKFFNASTAGNATITNQGGDTEFFNMSTAGNATITNIGNGLTQFRNTSTAGNATITNVGGVGIGNLGSGSTNFSDTSTAGNATITNGGNGLTQFRNTSTAGNATIINNGNGLTQFRNKSTAGNATITNNGVASSFASGGVTEFFNTSTAGNATIITNGVTGVGSGGTTFFSDSSDGGTARAITNGNGSFDISGLATAGMGIGSIEGGGNYFLGSKTLSVGGDNLSTTVSGVIRDGGNKGGTGGSLTKVGMGTLTLTGTNTYTGATTVNAGSLIVDGSIASLQTMVDASGLLSGNGSVGGSLVNSGIVSPSDSAGTLTVNGNYTQNAGGTLRIQIAGLAPSQHDLLAVNGHASLAGTLQLIGMGSFTLHAGDRLIFLTANGGVSGTFGTVQNEFATIVKARLVYDPNAVLLEGTQGSFVPGACTPNTVSVAQALDSAVGDPRAQRLIAFLDDQPLNQLCSDSGLISPEALASIFNIGISLANVQTANLKRRMDDIRAGSNGFSSAGFTLNGSAPNFSGGLVGVSGPEGKSGPSVMVPTPENRWGVWVTGIGEFTNVDSTGNAPGYYLETGGLSLGVDYRLYSNFAIGLTAGYAHTGADLANGGNLEVNGGKLGLYATAFGSGFYADAALTGGLSEYDEHRTALLGSATGSTNGGDLNVLIAGGYDLKKGGLSVGPTANFQYTYVGFSGFTESGSLAPLRFDNQNANSERTAFGMKASYDWKVGHVIIKPEINLAWQHEFGDQAYSIVSSFASGAGNSFSVNSPQIGRDSLLFGAGVAVLLSERISIYAYYDGELLRTNYQSNNVSAGVRVTF